jgi:hypothetical protein
MKISDNTKKVVITIGPSDNPYVKIYLPDKRSGVKDRRKSQAFIANNRRGGILDRRVSES